MTDPDEEDRYREELEATLQGLRRLVEKVGAPAVRDALAQSPLVTLGFPDEQRRELEKQWNETREMADAYLHALEVGEISLANDAAAKPDSGSEP